MSGFDLRSEPGEDCRIAEGATFDATTRWGPNVTLGEDAHVGPGVTLYDNVEVGPGAWIGPGCSLGEPTIGFYRDRDAYEGAATCVGADSILRRGTVINAGTIVGARFQTGPYAAIREDVTIGDD